MYGNDNEIGITVQNVLDLEKFEELTLESNVGILWQSERFLLNYVLNVSRFNNPFKFFSLDQYFRRQSIWYVIAVSVLVSLFRNSKLRVK
jgi:hypothetical protein